MEKTNKKKTKKAVKKTTKENFFKSVRKEMSLVKWPTKGEVVKNTVATVVMCLIVCGYFLLLNLLLSIIKGVM